MMRKTLAVLVAAIVLALTGCGGGSQAPGAEGPPSDTPTDPNATLRYATAYGVQSWDPHKTVSIADVILMVSVYEPLTHRDREGKAIPGLAESWDLAPDGHKLTLKLRQNVTFSDGEPFNADAVVKNLERAKEPDSITASALSIVSQVKAVDDATVELDLNRPGGALPLVLSDLPGMMVSPKAFATPEAADELATKPVGAGPFTLTSQQPGARYELAANPTYWDKDAVKVKGLIWEVMVDPQTRLNAIGSGQLDVAITTPSIIDQAKQQGLVVKTRASSNVSVLNFNQNRSQFAKPEVRKAIAYAIDKQEIVAGALEGHGAQAAQLFPEGAFGYDPSLTEPYPPDLDKAKQLLDEAGVHDLEFEAVVLNQPGEVTTAEIIKARLAKIGVTMRIRPVEARELSAVYNQGEADAIVTILVGRADPTQMLEAYFTQGSPLNPSKTEPDGLRAAIDEANRVSDPDQRTALIGKASRIVADNALLVPLASYELGGIATDQVVGYSPYPVGADNWRGVGIAR